MRIIAELLSVAQWQVKLPPSKHDTLKQCWFNVGPASQTVGQHLTNIVSMRRVFWTEIKVGFFIIKKVKNADIPVYYARCSQIIVLYFVHAID